MYLLDTDICIYIIKKHSENAVNRICKLKPQEIKISSVTVAELEYGASKSRLRETNRTALYNFLATFEVISFDSRDAEIYGIIRAELESNGNVIGPYDLQLAAQALARGLVFVYKEYLELKALQNTNQSRFFIFCG